jgi:hypothetical protein
MTMKVKEKWTRKVENSGKKRSKCEENCAEKFRKYKRGQIQKNK